MTNVLICRETNACYTSAAYVRSIGLDPKKMEGHRLDIDGLDVVVHVTIKGRKGRLYRSHDDQGMPKGWTSVSILPIIPPPI